MPTPQRLPKVNSDDGVWGDILRQYLLKEHYDDGTDSAANGGHQTITIRPGTASAGMAPLKFTSGTLLTTPETGAMEFAGDNYYLTDTSGPTRRKIAAYDDTSGATGDIYYRNSSGYFTRLGIGSTGDLLTVSGGIPSWSSSISNASTITLKDTNFTLQDDGDTTKQMQFQLSGITTGTIRTLTMPDADGTLVLKDSNGNITANNFNRSLTSTVANAATPITMTIASSAVQVVTGTDSQTINLPTTGVTAGTQYKFINKAAFTLNVKASNGGTTALLAANTILNVTAMQDTPTTAAHWQTQFETFANTSYYPTFTGTATTGTLAVNNTGDVSIYNTADQITNYERLKIYANTNVWTIESQKGGTGTLRSMAIIGGAGQININRTPNTNGSVNITSGIALAGAQFGVNGVLQLSSGTQQSVLINPTINQSSTAGYTALLVNPTETATGSGSNLLADFQVGGTSRTRIDNLGSHYISSAATNGLILFSTADEITNYTRLRVRNNSGTFQFTTEKAGTGAAAPMQFIVTGGSVGPAMTLFASGQANGNVQISSSSGNGTGMVGFTGSVSGSGGSANGVMVYPTVNQSGTAGYTAFGVNVSETATGSGTKLLADFQVGGVSKAKIDNTGVITSAVGTSSGNVVTIDGTQTLTNKTGSALTLTGATTVAQDGEIQLYNTADQTTNFERLRLYWTSNRIQFDVDRGGTGIARTLRISTSAASLQVMGAANATGAIGVSGNTGNTAAAVQFSVSGTMSATSTSQSSVAIIPTINNSSTGGYTALLINPTETSVGSGTKRLIDAQVGGTSRFTVDNAGVVNAVGGLQVNSVPVATTTGAETLTNKVIKTSFLYGSGDAANIPTVRFSSGYNAAGNNILWLQSAPNGSGPTLGVHRDGSANTAVPINLNPFGPSKVQVNSSATQMLTLYGSASQSSVSMTADGTATDVSLNLVTKGTGTVQANGTDVVTTTGTQTLTNKTMSGASNTFSNIPQSAVTNLTTNLSTKADVKVYSTNRQLTSPTTNTAISFDFNPESTTPNFMTNFFNDLAFFVERGGVVTSTKNGTSYPTSSYSNFNNVFIPDSSMAIDTVGASTDTYVIQLDLPASLTLRYGTYIGIVFPIYWNAKDITIEYYKSGVWTTLYTVTGSLDPVHIKYFSGDTTTITSLRYTLTNLHSHQLRISSLFAFDFSSPYLSKGYLMRNGGAIYGTSTTPVTFTATGGDTNIGINMVPKGTGTVQANGVDVATISATQTLTNKTLTTPKIGTSLLDSNGNTSIALTATASAVNYLTVTNGATGQGVQLYATGSDTNISWNLYSKGTGSINLRSNTNGVAFSAAPVASGVNYVQAVASATGNNVGVYAQGSDTNIGISLNPKGTGRLYTGGIEVTTISATQTLTNKTIDNTNTITLKDTLFTLQDDGDTTKQVQFQLSGVTTGTTRTLTVPDASGTIALTSDISAAASGGMLAPVQGMVNTETLTISSGSVTQITGTTVNGYTPAVGDRILIATAPAASGPATGYTMTTQPANGIYVVTNNTTNLTVSRATDMSGTVKPGGLSVYIENATWPASQTIFFVDTPNDASAFTWGTTSLKFTWGGGPNGRFRQIWVDSNTYSFNAWNGTGWVNINPTANAGSQTLTLPATGTDTIVARTSTDTLTNKRVTPRVGTTTSSATPTINTDNYDVYGLTAQAVDITSFTTNLTGTPTDGQILWVYVVGTASRAITWGSSFENGIATLPTTTTTTQRLDVEFMWNAATSKWRCMRAGSA